MDKEKEYLKTTKTTKVVTEPNKTTKIVKTTSAPINSKKSNKKDNASKKDKITTAKSVASKGIKSISNDISLGANDNKYSISDSINNDIDNNNQKMSNDKMTKTKSKKEKPLLKNTKGIYKDTGLQGKKKKILRRDNAGKLLASLSIISFVLIMAVVGQFFVMENDDPTNVLSRGTTINGVNVGGLEYIEAEQLIYDVFKEKSENFTLKICYEDREWNFDKDDFKVNSEIHTIIEEAQKRNQLVDDYDASKKKINKLTSEGKSINVAFNYIFVGLDDKIEEIIKEIEVPAVDSEIKFDADKKNCFTITDEHKGLRVNREQLYFDINDQFNKTSNIEVNLQMIDELPNITKEENIASTQLISTFTTYVSDSTGNRKSNVKRALNKFNGLIIEPDQEISFNKITGPHTLDNGYKIATVIYNGQFVDGVGGGICQASTTLYNALVLANVDILEVHKHTLPVKYVPLALDAMVSEYSADLKFKNTLDTPIYIQTLCDSEKVTVNVYGCECEYEIKTRSETVEVIKNSGDKVIYDYDKKYTDKVLFKGEQYRLTYPRNGYEVKAYADYFKDGELVEEKEIRHEYYLSQQGLIVEGVEEVPAGLNAIETNAVADKIEENFVPTNVCP